MDLVALTFAFFLFSLALSESKSFEFVFNGFNNTNLAMEGVSAIKPSGALELTNTLNHVIGQAFYPTPIHIFDTTNSSLRRVSSFSTSFVFAMVTPDSEGGGYGLAFAIAPSSRIPGASDDHYLGLFNRVNDGNPSNHIFAVEFDTVNGFNDNSNSKGNHVGVNNNSVLSIISEPAAYYVNNTDAKEDMELRQDPIRAWIDYDSNSSMLSVTIAPYDHIKPSKPLILKTINLSYTFLEEMYVGFTASTGDKASFHYILAWSFGLNSASPELNLTQILLPREENKSSSNNIEIKTLVSILSAGVFCLLGLLFFYIRRRMTHEDLEDWELDCPHRFQFKDLSKATNGFKKSEIIGIGGFGVVYKGALPTTKTEVAVKKISRNSIQGMREFVAEIESLGKLRHKNLINLQGWCKRKTDLLLVYDYVPNGSLDSLLFKCKDGFVLSWEERFSILKGVAAGLLYLHEEWEKVVIHRDVKSNNVLIDADMNAKLGDFGLARLYDHGQISYTTNIVGTIGYLAPEFGRTGKSSTCSDVFAYGILMLEVACGRKPVESDQFVLTDWVIECHEKGKIIDAVDQKLNSIYVPEEVELVLRLGLLCSHNEPEQRPRMHQLVRYLHGDDPLPVIRNWGSIASHSFDGYNFTALEISSSSYTASTGPMSSGSLPAGR